MNILVEKISDALIRIPIESLAKAIISAELEGQNRGRDKEGID